MRVNVTYSVELEEVKQIVKEILHKVEDSAKNVDALFSQIVEYSGGDNEKKAVELIEICRNDLLLLDHSLFDCKNILTGYQQTVLEASADQNSQNVQNVQNKLKEVIDAQGG